MHPLAKPKRLALLYSDCWIYHSPHTLNLYELLQKRAQVLLLTNRPEFTENIGAEKELPEATYLNEITLGLKICVRLENILHQLPPFFGFLRKKWAVDWYYAVRTFWCLLRFQPDEVIVCDVAGLKYTRFWPAPKHMIVLEIRESEAALWKRAAGQIKSVVSQSQERVDWLFPQSTLPKFVARNSRIYRRAPSGEKERTFLYTGGLFWEFGLRPMLSFARESGERLRLQGYLSDAIFQEIKGEFAAQMESGQITFSGRYIPHHELELFVQRFHMGFCFYDMDMTTKSAFNYRTGSPGKLYTYLAAGVPVICSDLPGMSVVREENCGVAVASLQTENLIAAARQIDANYDFYRNNCLKAAQKYSFDKEIAGYLDYLCPSPQSASVA